MILTPVILRATYTMLDECRPFCLWNMPDADDVVFKVGRSKENCGHYLRGKKTHLIAVNSHFHGRLHNLVETMAHEMIHLHVWRHPSTRRGVDHNPAWRQYADDVCNELGFDRTMFGGCD